MKFIKVFLFLLVVVIIVSFNELISSNREKIIFLECVDGDTARFIINNKNESVRFLGIDAPEYTKEKEEYGYEASMYTCSLLENATDIYIEYDINSNRRDKYNRVLGYVFVDNNNLSELLLSSGYAEVKYIYGDYKYIDDLCLKQDEAYRNRLGIWSINYNEYFNNYCYLNNY